MPEEQLSKTYRVIGTRKYRGNAPGSTFDAVLDPEAEARALARGAIEVVGEQEAPLESKTREELNAIASAAGVEDPAALKDKAAVADAIRAKDN